MFYPIYDNPIATSKLEPHDANHYAVLDFAGGILHLALAQRNADASLETSITFAALRGGI